MTTLDPQDPAPTGEQRANIVGMGVGDGPGPDVMAASTLEGNKVMSSDGEHVGKIADIMLDVRSGRRSVLRGEVVLIHDSRLRTSARDQGQPSPRPRSSDARPHKRVDGGGLPARAMIYALSRAAAGVADLSRKATARHVMPPQISRTSSFTTLAWRGATGTSTTKGASQSLRTPVTMEHSRLPHFERSRRLLRTCTTAA